MSLKDLTAVKITNHKPKMTENLEIGWNEGRIDIQDYINQLGLCGETNRISYTLT